MDRQENKTPSISPTPDSDSTNLSVETIINNNAQHTTKNQPTPTAVKSINTPPSAHKTDGDAHLYNIVPDLVTNPKKDKEIFSTETIVSQNPNINNASASSSVTLITGPNKSNLPITIWLAIVQLLLSIALTTLGGLLLARNATLAQTGSGIWAGGIAAIAGALGVINVRKAQTGFLAVSLICVASSTLALALTGIGLVRDLNLENTHGAITASSGLILTLSMHLIISVLSVYHSAMRLCSRSQSNGQMVDNVISNQNSTYLSQQRIEQYFKSLHESNGKQMIYPTLVQKNVGKSGSEKYSIGESVMPYWLPQSQKKHSIPTMPHHRPMVLVPAGVGNGSQRESMSFTTMPPGVLANSRHVSEEDIQIALAPYIQTYLSQTGRRHSCCSVMKPVAFERAASKSWLDPCFDSAVLEGQYQASVFPQIRLRFRFNNCFGVLGVLDRLHGTDSMFRNTLAFPRHIMMLSLIPPREAFPDPQKKQM